MKYLSLLAVLFFIGCKSSHKDLDAAYEAGIMDGSTYTFEHGYYPSMWHREAMHHFHEQEYDWKNIYWHNTKIFWDSVKVKYLGYDTINADNIKWKEVPNSVGMVAGIYLQSVSDTAKVTPVSLYKFNFNYFPDIDFYDLYMEGNKGKPSMTIDTSGVIVINDSLEIIRTFLWYLKNKEKW